MPNPAPALESDPETSAANTDPRLEQSAGDEELDRMLDSSLRMLDEDAPPGCPESVLEGRVQDISLPNLLQTFESHRQSGLLEVHFGPRSGWIRVNRGRVVAARVDRLMGAAAFYRLLRFGEGRFAFFPNAGLEAWSVEEPGLGVSTHTLILESLRHLEEAKRLEDLIPNEDSVLRPPECSRGEDIFSLSEAALMLFLTIQDETTIGQLRTTTEFCDLELTQAVADLIEAKLLLMPDDQESVDRVSA